MCCVAFANGANDISRAAATLVGSGIGTYRKTLRWGIAWTLVGSLLSGIIAGGVAQGFAQSVAAAVSVHPCMIYAIASGAIVWVAFATFKCLPVSTTHAILGSVLAMKWLARGTPPWADPSIFKGFFIPLLSSPVISLVCLLVVRALSDKTTQWLNARRVSLHAAKKTGCLSLDRAHWISSGLVGMSRGINDSAKIWALIIPLIAITGTHGALLLPAAVVFVALSMALGSWLAGQRVTELLADRITKMRPEEGLFANASTALIIITASFLGFPVASSHVIGGAIIGVGLSRSERTVNWSVVSEMVMSWVCTLPGAGVLATVCYSLSYPLVHHLTPLLRQQPLATFLFVGAGLLSALAMALLRSGRVRLMSRRPASSVATPIAVIQRLFLFVCSGNTSRSPMAQAICNAEIAKRLKIPLESLHQFGVEALSAGLSAKAGTPMNSEAQDALREMGITDVIHTARKLDAQMVNRAEAVFCMTEEQRVAAMARFPDAASKIYRLDPEGDMDDPSGKGSTTFVMMARVLKRLISERLTYLAVGTSASGNYTVNY